MTNKVYLALYNGDVASIASTAPRQPKQSSPALAKCRHSREWADYTI